MAFATSPSCFLIYTSFAISSKPKSDMYSDNLSAVEQVSLPFIMFDFVWQLKKSAKISF